MEKIKRKKSIIKYFGFTLLFVCLSLCFVFYPKTDSWKAESNAVGNFAEDSNVYISPLTSNFGRLPESYNIMDEYPVLPENQTNTNFCWIYAPMKSLETTLMKATGEYYNFSETATALLAYLNKWTTVFNSTGNFDEFDSIVNHTGLVFESEMSNDKFLSINDKNAENLDLNAENFSYITKKANKNIYKQVRAIDFSASTVFAGAGDNLKQNYLKSFIETYGSVFIGIRQGTIYKGTSGNTFTSEINEGAKDDGGIIIGADGIVGHAVSLVGWDEYGFIALNSWGVESSSFSTFRIPFDCDNIYDVLFCYVYVGEDPVEVYSSSATKFSQNILNSSKEIKNVFTYDEILSIQYSVPANIDFSTTLVKIYRGEQDVTKLFSLNYNAPNRKIEITSNFGSEFCGGTFVVYIYQDINLVGVKNFTVFTGTELSYLRLDKDTSERVKVYNRGTLLSSMFDVDNVATFYVPQTESFKLYMNLTAFNSNTPSMTPLVVFDSNIYVYKNVGNGLVQKELIDSSLSSYFTGSFLTIPDPNQYLLNIKGLTNFVGQRIELKFTVSSYYSISRDYYINIFVSSFSTLQSSNAKTIDYVLNGGENSVYNITKFPDYSKETTMTNIELFDPVRPGYDFLGWFTDEAMQNEITVIDKTCTTNLILYAKFREQSVSYFDFDANLYSITNYENQETLWNGGVQIVYGDSVKIRYLFNESAYLVGQNYSHKYYLYLNGRLIAETHLETGDIDTLLVVGFPTLKSGSTVVKIVSVVVVGRNITASEEKSLSFTVKQKKLSFNFDQNKLNFVYDGKPHSPIDSELGAIIVDGLYDEDKNSFVYSMSNSSKINAGTYVYKISNINNHNYTFDENESVSMTISKREIDAQFYDLVVTYNGKYQSPKYRISGMVEGESITLNISSSSKKDVGIYDIVVENISNPNYAVKNNITEKFMINPAEIILRFEDVTDRLQTPKEFRTALKYDIKSGTIFEGDDIGIVPYCEALTSDKSGVFKITATTNNKNYKIVVYDANYTLTGYYYVFYTLPNGEKYTELGNEGENPKGIDRSIYPKGLFEVYSYSQPLVNINEDLYIEVSIKNYFWVYTISVVILIFVVVYLVITRKQRRNKTR